MHGVDLISFVEASKDKQSGWNTLLTCGKLVKRSARGEWEGKQKSKHEPACKIAKTWAFLCFFRGLEAQKRLHWEYCRWMGTLTVQLLVSPHLGVQRIGAQQRVPPQAAPPLVPPLLHFCVHQSVRLRNWNPCDFALGLKVFLTEHF